MRKAVRRLDERLWHQLEEIWRRAEEGIHDAQRSKDGHQQGTPHCRAVEDNLSAFIPDDWKGSRFTAIDLFILSTAAALHDVGKAGDTPDDHGHVSMWEVRSRAEIFGLNQGQAEIVGWIARAHNDGNLNALPPTPVPIGSAEVNLRPLAALFKLADALHTDFRRVSLQVVEFGGKHAEDNPKTRFRLRVRGWRFDEGGGIELYAVPKDWDDVAVIHTGFEFTRRELEPIIPTLKEAGFPHELNLRLDEANLKRDGQRQVEVQQRIERVFVGMDYFTEQDASRFKGRDLDTRTLLQRVMGVPLTLLVGDSGIGKTSLIQAGLFPQLHQAQWRTAYTRPFDDPDRFVVSDLWRDVLKEPPSANSTIEGTMERACKAVGNARLLVVLDQFEDVARVPLPSKLEGLRQALLVVQAERFRNLRLLVSYRADAEATMGPIFQKVAGSDRGLPRIYLQPLNRSGAQAALEAGFSGARVTVQAPLLDIIADELNAQTMTPGVYPPYVQMVGETLCAAAGQENNGVLTDELYQAKGCCSGIIGHYLWGRLAIFKEKEHLARQVLIALVRSTGVKGQRSLEELQAETKLSAEQLESLVAELVNQRMIRPLSGGQYEIIHDHLALLVNQELVDTRERQLRELRELLDLKARAYETTHIPLQTPDMARLFAVREHITPGEDQMRLLLHSCLLGQGPAWFWLRDAPRAKYIPLLRDALTRPISRLRCNTTPFVTRATGREAIPELREMLKDQDGRVRLIAVEAITKVAEREDIPYLRAILKDQAVDVRLAALKALAQVAGREDIPNLLKHQDTSVQRAATETMLRVVEPEVNLNWRTLLKDQDGRVRQVAVEAIAKIARLEAIPDLRGMLKDKDKGVRQAAVEALAQVAGWEGIAGLREMLRDEDKEIKRAALKALAQEARREVIPDFLNMLKDADVYTRQLAAAALIQVAGRQDIPTIQEMLVDKNQNAGRAAAKVIEKVAGQEDIPILKGMLKHQDTLIRRAAAKALARVAGPEVPFDWRALLKDRDRIVRQAAVEALTKVAGREAISDLRGMLKDRNNDVREAAVEALAQVAGWECIADLQEILKDQDKVVRQAALGVMAQVAGREDVPNLQEMLKDPDPNVREAALNALAKAAGHEALPDLRALLKDGNKYVRQKAIEALSQLVTREDIPDLRDMLRDKDTRARGAAVKLLKRLVSADDLTWLAEWVSCNLLTETSKCANRILMYLDQKLYCSIEVTDGLEQGLG